MIDRSILNVLESAKAYAALLGSLLTVLTASVDGIPAWVSLVTALLTAFATWAVPNATPAAHDDFGSEH